MSCSKDSALKDMMRKGIIETNLSVSDSSSSRLFDYINFVTNIAKNKYKVDMGPLFLIRSKTVGQGLTGEVLLRKVEPNEAAFAAIDMSAMMQTMAIEKEIADARQQAFRQQAKEYQDLKTEGNYDVVEGEVVAAVFNSKGLPQINIRC